MTHMVRAQFIRYVLVGVVVNAALYGTYLLLTWWILGSKTAMTITFSVGLLLSFLANRRLTFRHRGDEIAALGRFLACYAIVYLIDFIALWVFAGHLRVPHQIVQGCAVLTLPLPAFMMQKYWVFPAATRTVGQAATRIT